MMSAPGCGSRDRVEGELSGCMCRGANWPARGISPPNVAQKCFVHYPK